MPRTLVIPCPTRTDVSYSANITAGALKVTESRVIADLLLCSVDQAAWHEAIVDTNVLQTTTPSTAVRIGRLVHARLGLMRVPLWRLVRDGTTTVATQACLAAAVKHSAMLGDFMDLVLRERYRQRLDVLPTSVWEEYLNDCRSRDPDMPQWHESTQRRLRSTVYQSLAQVGYIDSTQTRRLQAVHIAEPVLAYLHDNDEDYILRCIEVSP